MRIWEFALPDPGYGVYTKPRKPAAGSNISKTATALSRKIRRRGIQPGDADWFSAWFSRPYLTGEKPFRK
jgi:hypothetical protein